jgi:NAD-dependent dihydropyrimidine dehydrogenase PreA subunit
MGVLSRKTHPLGESVGEDSCSVRDSGCKSISEFCEVDGIDWGRLLGEVGGWSVSRAVVRDNDGVVEGKVEMNRRSATE